MRLRALAQRLEEHLDDLDVNGTTEGRKTLLLVGVVELLDAEREDGVVVACRHHGARLVERGRRARAGVLDVDHRDAADADAAQDHLAADAFLAGDQPGGGIADEGSLQGVGVDARVGERGLHRFRPQRFEAGLHVLAESRHANAADHSIELHGWLLLRPLILTAAHVP